MFSALLVLLITLLLKEAFVQLAQQITRLLLSDAKSYAGMAYLMPQKFVTTEIRDLGMGAPALVL